MSNQRRPAIRNFDDFVEESKMLSDGNEPEFAITNPLELHFMHVADKHGVIDEICDEAFYDNF